jgi:hypothetical protein
MSSSQKRGEGYRAMLALLGSDVRYARHLCGAAQPADFEPLSQALIGVFGELRRPLVLVRAALAEESVLIMNYINLHHPPPIFHSLPLVPWLFFHMHMQQQQQQQHHHHHHQQHHHHHHQPAFMYTY